MMTTPDLSNLRVLVTRPHRQAREFIKRLHTAGALSFEFPSIEIEYRQSLAGNDIQRALDSDLLIFTSTNAVTGAVECQLVDRLLPGNKDKAAGQTIAAIGQATREHLQQQRLEVRFAPAVNTDSEGFINQFKDSIKPDSNITIVRGSRGREVLKQQLELLGAKVTYLSVYDQVLPKINEVDARRLLQNALPCVISITSDLGLQNLLQLIPPDTQNRVFACPLVVNSQRCAKLAEDKGFRAAIAVACPPGDVGQIRALATL